MQPKSFEACLLSAWDVNFNIKLENTWRFIGKKNTEWSAKGISGKQNYSQIRTTLVVLAGIHTSMGKLSGVCKL